MRYISHSRYEDNQTYIKQPLQLSHQDFGGKAGRYVFINL